MDDFDDRLTGIIARIQSAPLTDEEKADAYASLRVGLHKLVWPILVSHIPENELKDVVDHPETLTVVRYGQLIGKALDDPATAKEIHTEVMEALSEVEAVVVGHLPPSPPPLHSA